MKRREWIAAALASAGFGQSFSGGARVGGAATVGPGSAPRDYVMWVGQSLATGGLGSPALTTTQPYTNTTFNGGSILGDGAVSLPPTAAIASIVPLAEGIGVNKESACSAFGNQVGAFARATGRGATKDMLVASWAKSGSLYSAVKKGTTPYDYSITSVIKAVELLGAVRVPALMCVHGEADGSCGYAQTVTDGYPSATTWQSDYETDIKAITGQSGSIPMFISQTNFFTECTSAGNPRPPWFYDGMLGLYEQYGVNLQPNAKFVMVGPKYQLAQNADKIHLTNTGYRVLGELYAKAYWKMVVLGEVWDCLRPTASSVNGSTVTITFHVPSPPLVFDTVTLANPGSYGFTYLNNDGIVVDSVSITDDGTGTNVGVVQLQLSSAPINTTNINLTYAAQYGNPRGNLRDSDPTVGISGEPLYNWCVQFCKKLNWTCCAGTA